MVARNSGARDLDAELDTQRSITDLVLLLLEIRGPNSRAELAKEIGLQPPSLTNSLSHGKRQREWRVHDLKMLANYYGVPADAFLGDDEAHDLLIEELEAEARRRIRGQSSPAT